VFLTGYGVYMMLLTPLWPAKRRGAAAAATSRGAQEPSLSMSGRLRHDALRRDMLFFFTEPVLRLFKGAQD